MSLSVSDLVEALGTDVLTPWFVPGTGDAVLEDVLFHEATEAFAGGPGDLLLAVGLTASQVGDLLGVAGSRGVVAVACRAPISERDALRLRAREAGVTLLALGPAAGWARLTSQVRSLLSTSGSAPLAELTAATRHDLVSVANTLAAAVGGSVLIFNPQQDLLAASRMDPDADDVRHRAVFAQHGPSEYRSRLRELGVYDTLWRSDEVVEVQPIPELGATRREAVAVRAGEEILGSIWVAEGARPLVEDSRAILRNAARLVGEQLVARQDRGGSQRQFAEDLTRQVLSGGADAAAASWLDLDPHRPSRVVGILVPEESRGDSRRLADLLQLYFSAYRQRALTVVSGGLIHVITVAAEGGAPDERSACDTVARAASALALEVRAVVGPAAGTLDAVPDSRAAVERGLRVLTRAARAGSEVRTVEELLPAVQALRLVEVAGPEVASEGAVPVLLAHDAEHGTSLAETLGAWLDAFGDVASAGRRLHVHPNTVRYRLRKAVAVSGIDLDDPDDRLVAAVALRASLLSGPPTSDAMVDRSAKPVVSRDP